MSVMYHYFLGSCQDLPQNYNNCFFQFLVDSYDNSTVYQVARLGRRCEKFEDIDEINDDLLSKCREAGMTFVKLWSLQGNFSNDLVPTSIRVTNCTEKARDGK